jgi:tetratricopeptide (TPR) repeat protein
MLSVRALADRFQDLLSTPAWPCGFRSLRTEGSIMPQAGYEANGHALCDRLRETPTPITSSVRSRKNAIDPARGHSTHFAARQSTRSPNLEFAHRGANSRSRSKADRSSGRQGRFAAGDLDIPGGPPSFLLSREPSSQQRAHGPQSPAIERQRRCSRIPPRCTRIWRTCSRNTAEPDDAAQSYRKAIALEPDFVEAHVGLGNIMHLHGKHERAVDCHRRAVALRPEYATAHLSLAHALQKLWPQRRSDRVLPPRSRPRAE